MEALSLSLCWATKIRVETSEKSSIKWKLKTSKFILNGAGKYQPTQNQLIPYEAKRIVWCVFLWVCARFLFGFALGNWVWFNLQGKLYCHPFDYECMRQMIHFANCQVRNASLHCSILRLQIYELYKEDCIVKFQIEIIIYHLRHSVWERKTFRILHLCKTVLMVQSIYNVHCYMCCSTSMDLNIEVIEWQIQTFTVSVSTQQDITMFILRIRHG